MRTIRHIWLLCVLIGLLAGYTYLIRRGKFSLFVHPKLHLFTYSMIALMVLIVVYMIYTLEDTKKITRYSMQGTMSLLVVMAALFPALRAQLDPRILTVVQVDANDVGGAIDQPGWTDEASSDMGKYTDKAFIIKPVQRDNAGNIRITPSNYYATITELYNNVDVYTGEVILASGVVYQIDEDAGSDSIFGVGMYYMTCCAADAQLVGLRYMTDGVVPHIGQWVSVQGTVGADQTGKPIIAVTTMRPIPPMEDPYMYR